MLKKECCKQCRNNISKIWGWTDYDELRWKEGIIECPFAKYKYGGKYWAWIKIKDKPPEKCPYYLENII